MTEEEIRNSMRHIEESVQVGNTSRLLGIGLEMLVRLVAAQEAIVHLAHMDLDAQVEEAIKTRAEDRANQMVAEQTKRTFIGKK